MVMSRQQHRAERERRTDGGGRRLQAQGEYPFVCLNSGTFSSRAPLSDGLTPKSHAYSFYTVISLVLQALALAFGICRIAALTDFRAEAVDINFLMHQPPYLLMDFPSFFWLTPTWIAFMQSFQSPQYIHGLLIDRATYVRMLIAGKDSPTLQCLYMLLYSIQVVEVIDEDEEVKEVKKVGF